MANNLFKRRDAVLKDLVAARRDEVLLVQDKRTKQLEDLEIRGAKQIARLKKILPKNFVAVLDSLDKIHRRSAFTANSTVEDAKAALVTSSPSKENETAIHPGLTGNCLIVPNTRA